MYSLIASFLFMNNCYIVTCVICLFITHVTVPTNSLSKESLYIQLKTLKWLNFTWTAMADIIKLYTGTRENKDRIQGPVQTFSWDAPQDNYGYIVSAWLMVWVMQIFEHRWLDEPVTLTSQDNWTYTFFSVYIKNRGAITQPSLNPTRTRHGNKYFSELAWIHYTKPIATPYTTNYFSDTSTYSR